MALVPSLWVALLSFFTVIPSALMIARLCMDFKQVRKRGYTHHIVVGTVCAGIAWICLLVASGMAFWRNERRDMLMGRHAEKSNRGGRLPEMEALGRPLIEATILHSYVVPTGLWLVKGSFVAMCEYPVSPCISLKWVLFSYGFLPVKT